MVAALAISATSASIGFLGATLEPHLRQFNLSPVLLGMVFVINGAMYALTAPVWGWMVDKWLNPKIAAFIGSVLIVIGFSLIGPASFLPIEMYARFAIQQ
jgi:MFS family permease